MRNPQNDGLRSAVASLMPAAILIAGCASPGSSSTTTDRSSTPLTRHYVEGETIRYLMTGVNEGREYTINYMAEAEALVQRDDQGRFVEEFRWTRLVVAGQEVPLDEASADFRQRLSLDQNYEMVPPRPGEISGINPMLIGPVFDLMTFYVDLHPSLHQGRLVEAGDSVYVEHGQPNSWADGTNTLVGEDCIDFELTLEGVSERAAQLRVRHVPPQETSIKLPAAWMQERVNPKTANNWVQVQRDVGDSGVEGYIAAAGHEVFDVVIEVERPSGRIVSATMDNPVDVVHRHCTDAALEDCGEEEKYRIRRQIELRRVP